MTTTTTLTAIRNHCYILTTIRFVFLFNFAFFYEFTLHMLAVAVCLCADVGC